MNKKGFTLIELIIVIVILGILAAIAIPRFAGLSGDARKAALKGMAGSVKAAAVIAHGKWLVNPSVSSITMEGKSVSLYNGYPKEETGGIDNAVDYDETKYEFAEGADNDTNTKAYFKLDNLTNCSVSYNIDSGAKVEIDDTGCPE